MAKKKKFPERPPRYVDVNDLITRIDLERLFGLSENGIAKWRKEQGLDAAALVIIQGSGRDYTFFSYTKVLEWAVERGKKVLNHEDFYAEWCEKLADATRRSA